MGGESQGIWGGKWVGLRGEGRGTPRRQGFAESGERDAAVELTRAEGIERIPSVLLLNLFRYVGADIWVRANGDENTRAPKSLSPSILGAKVDNNELCIWRGHPDHIWRRYALFYWGE